ncbi:MAG TPA: response regulator [Polyangiaceae bacterium]|nr:response regulator [Polyangiaceae bacterium]
MRAYGGREALALFEERGPDLVLLDLMMPGFDGLDTLAYIRASPGGDEVPVVFRHLAAFSSDSGKSAGLRTRAHASQPGGRAGVQPSPGWIAESPCWCLLFKAKAGSPMDRFGDCKTGADPRRHTAAFHDLTAARVLVASASGRPGGQVSSRNAARYEGPSGGSHFTGGWHGCGKMAHSLNEKFLLWHRFSFFVRERACASM